ncbi:MAG: hypothetical protein LBP87_10205 [Planctomycetaceae bacterium]|nr:hypothetical protein [Planctomycetaceae bacterium]
MKQQTKLKVGDLSPSPKGFRPPSQRLMLFPFPSENRVHCRRIRQTIIGTDTIDVFDNS